MFGVRIRKLGNDDDDNLTDDQLLEMPTEAMPDDLSLLWAVRAAALHNREFNELVAELTGASNSHLMIFRDQDPRVKRHREKEAARHAAQEMQDYLDRSNHLLARIDEQERVLAKRRQEIEDNALKLLDGRRVYVDGNQYRDENGNILSGNARDEAAELHRGNPQAVDMAAEKGYRRQVWRGGEAPAEGASGPGCRRAGRGCQLRQ